MEGIGALCHESCGWGSDQEEQVVLLLGPGPGVRGGATGNHSGR